MGRKPSPNPKAVQLAFRIDTATAKALDDVIAIETTERPGLPLSRSDIARMLMTEALIARAKRRGAKK